jgi:hypothetical protein
MCGRPVLVLPLVALLVTAHPLVSPTTHGYDTELSSAGDVIVFPGLAHGASGVQGEPLFPPANPGRRVDGGGIISGLVVNEANEPLPHAAVRLQRALYTQGEESVWQVGSTTADAEGTFRFEGLPAGRYYLAAWAPDAPADTATSSGELAPTYYPGTGDPDRAEAIRVALGRETSGLYLRVLSMPLRTISGSVVDSSGRPPPDAIILLNPASIRALLPSAIVTVNMRARQASQDGRFEFTHVAPGEYRIEVLPESFFAGIAQHGTVGIGRRLDDSSEFASVLLRVMDENIEDLIVRLERGVSLSGRIVTETATSAERRAVLSRMRVVAHEVSTGQSRVLFSGSGDVADDGTFVLPSLIGHRVIRVEDAPGWMLKEIRTLALDITDEGLEMGSDRSDLELVLTRETRIEGRSIDERGGPVARGVMVVFPQDRQRWTYRLNRWIREMRTDESGRFLITGLPAGEYYAAALAEDRVGDYDLEELVSGAVRFTLTDGEQRALQLRRR